MREISITLTIADETEESLRIPASKLIRYELARDGAATLIVYIEITGVRTALVCESPREVAHLVWAALRPGPTYMRGQSLRS